MPNYQMEWFHKHICDKLDAFERGDIRKLMVFMPPQHGKSELTTRRFPSYLAGKNPNSRIAIASYNATLASRFNRDIQRIIDNSVYNEIFPKTYLNDSNVVTVSDNYIRNSEIFEFVGHSGYVKTVGRGGALTGTSVDVGIIDDPLKDRAEAQSAVIREGLWSWYNDVFRSRFHNNTKEILIQTRWHKQDLGGRLLAIENDWEVIVFEAIKETDFDYDIREIGEALYPKKHSLERILRIKENSPITFNSLYQQSPELTEDMGLLWSQAMIDRCRLSSIGVNIIRTVIAIDPATTSTEKSDEVGIIAFGVDSDNNGYLLEDGSGIYTPIGWANEAKRLKEKWKASCYVAEKNQGGEMITTVINQVDNSTRVNLVHVSKSKFTRAEPVFAAYQKNRIFHVGTFEKLEKEMITFNPEMNKKSPNRVDALVLGATDTVMGIKHFVDWNSLNTEVERVM
jgi:hypothetical protein